MSFMCGDLQGDGLFISFITMITQQEFGASVWIFRNQKLLLDILMIWKDNKCDTWSADHCWWLQQILEIP